MSVRKKKFWSYILSIGLAIAVVVLIGQLLSWLISWVYPVETIAVSKGVGVFVSVIVVANVLAKFIRTNPSPISIGATNIPNYFYDEYFQKSANVADESLLTMHAEQQTKIIELEDLLRMMTDQITDGNDEIRNIKYTMDIFVRHHKNTSRLVRSLTGLMIGESPNWLWEFCHNVLSECVTTLTKDRADKSSTLYRVQDDRLVMFTYSRIEHASTRDRSFKKGEGFAGYIWQIEQQALEDDVSQSEHFQGAFAPRHSYGSILGCPVKIADNVLGVLCIQSEKTKGFEQDDLIITQFYADILALAFYCGQQNDILHVEKLERSGSYGK